VLDSDEERAELIKMSIKLLLNTLKKHQLIIEFSHLEATENYTYDSYLQFVLITMHSAHFLKFFAIENFILMQFTFLFMHFLHLFKSCIAISLLCTFRAVL